MVKINIFWKNFRRPLRDNYVWIFFQKMLILAFEAKISFTVPTISATFTIVSRCFENKNNNYCETKMPFVYLKKLSTKPFLATLQLGCLDNRVARLGICLPFFMNKWHFFFTTNIVVNFKTSGYNGGCGRLWVHTVKLIFALS